ncbi:transposase [Streptomyces sp. KR55]|uniref:transposase n=1 Tax=Streptomyces sp. KR55 TaxID=3457425 RepID=UPI003FD1ACD2
MEDHRVVFPLVPASDLSDEQWALIEPVITAWKDRHRSVSGHQGAYEMREIVNAILYQSRTGCQWACLPHDLPPKSATYHRLHEALKALVTAPVKPSAPALCPAARLPNGDRGVHPWLCDHRLRPTTGMAYGVPWGMPRRTPGSSSRPSPNSSTTPRTGPARPEPTAPHAVPSASTALRGRRVAGYTEGTKSVTSALSPLCQGEGHASADR